MSKFANTNLVRLIPPYTQGGAGGFTLIELVVSIALLALLTFGVATLFPRGIGVVTRSASLTAATNLAQAQIETVLGQDYQSVPTGTFEPRHTVTGRFERQTIVSYINPSTLLASTTDLGLKRADVTVFYPAISGQKTFVLSTLIVKK